MLVAVAIPALVSASVAGAAVATEPRARRAISAHVPGVRFVAATGAVLIAVSAALQAVWAPVAALPAGLALGVAVWTLRPVRRRWGHPLPPGPDWNWDRFERSFRAYVERTRADGTSGGMARAPRRPGPDREGRRPPE
jgi:hypothetical protein